MIKTIEKLAHLSVLGIVVIFLLVIYAFMPVYDIKIAVSLTFIVVAFLSCLIIFRQLLGLLLVSLFLLMIVVGFITQSILDALFFSSIGITVLVLFNILER
jgi:hypothetical protein